MNPFHLSVSDLLLWGVVAHLIADWPLQTDWMANHKALRWVSKRRRLRWQGAHKGWVFYVPENDRYPGAVPPWWSRHPAAYVHAGVHGVALAPVFGWPAAVIAVVHLLIDTRTPLAWWSRLIGQTQPRDYRAVSPDAANPDFRPYEMNFDDPTFKIKSSPGVTVQQSAQRLQAISGVAYEGAVALSSSMNEARQTKEKLDRLMRDMTGWTVPVYDIGAEVRIWTDQVTHIAVIAVAALLVG